MKKGKGCVNRPNHEYFVGLYDHALTMRHIKQVLGQDCYLSARSTGCRIAYCKSVSRTHALQHIFDRIQL